MRKKIPDYFIVFRVDHPISLESYANGSTDELFKEVFGGAKIIKSFDIRKNSALGGYLRKIVEDPRFVERPLEVSFDSDVLTTWNGISYKEGTLTGKGELLNDFWQIDRPIKEFERFMTEGYERNGIICANLMNLEFLFDDEEAQLYSINRYIGLYVTEIQLAEFELSSQILGEITGQIPPPKRGVDGEPYSVRRFVQTNPDGIELPVDYYHNTTYENNNSIIPYYQGNVVGKFPLPNMVDDPLRFFYVKDKNDAFKRVISLSEVDYGFPGSEEYKRVTQLKLFDTKEDISSYGGPVQITSQDDASLLKEGNSQLVIHLMNQGGGKVIADGEVLELNVSKYIVDRKQSDYYFQVTAASGTATSFVYFQDQEMTRVSANFTQPSAGGTASVSFDTTTYFSQGETIYIVNGGFYAVEEVQDSVTAVVKNIGGEDNASPASTVSADSLVRYVS